MKLIKLETFKLLRAPAILCFLAVCLITNIVVVFMSSERNAIEYYNEVGPITGYVYGDEYMENLKNVPVPDNQDFGSWRYEYLVSGAENAHNVFEGLNVYMRSCLSEEAHPYSELAMQINRWKYGLLEPVIENKASADEGSAVYFGVQTQYIHESVFVITGKLLGFEALVFFALIMIWALGFENMAGTSLVTLATKTGRRQIYYKAAGALICGVVFFIILYGVTYGLTFTVNDFSQVWHQNVSAQYNSSNVKFLGVIPFVTWSSMSVGGYFFACVGAALLNCVAAALFAVPFGLLIRNTYAAFCAIAGICFVHFLAYSLYNSEIDVPFVWHLLLIPPLTQLLNNEFWFTDGGMRMLLPHFEMLYPLIFTLLLSPVIIVSAKLFKRKDTE